MEKDKRMLEILKKLDEPHEVFSNDKKEIDLKEILKENNRFKSLISVDTNSDFKNENYYIAGKFGTGGRGKTVNSIFDNYKNNATETTPKVSPSSLKSNEALEVCIKRVLKSGTPVNNITFYDEVNWNLMNLGFPAVNEIDIKTAILSLIGE
jgi:uncharacterized GH25 family protein